MCSVHRSQRGACARELATLASNLNDHHHRRLRLFLFKLFPDCVEPFRNGCSAIVAKRIECPEEMFVGAIESKNLISIDRIGDKLILKNVKQSTIEKKKSIFHFTADDDTIQSTNNFWCNNMFMSEFIMFFSVVFWFCFLFMTFFFLHLIFRSPSISKCHFAFDASVGSMLCAVCCRYKFAKFLHRF